MLPLMLGIGYIYAESTNTSQYLANKSNEDYGELINNQIFEEVKSNLDNRFYSWNASNTLPTDEEKKYNIIKGYVSSYKDPFTQYFPPQEAKTFMEDVKGSFGGVGMHIEMKNDIATIVAPLKNSAAYKAGLKSADMIISVDDEDMQGKSTDIVAAKIRGDIGTNVKIRIFRPDIKEFKEFVITREETKVPTVDTETIGDVFVIHLYSFTLESPELFKQALIEYLKTNKKKIIIDLRGNPGGYLDSAIAITSFFLDSGLSVVTEKSNSLSQSRVHGSLPIKAIDNTHKIYVLVDGGSASASEIFAGALKDYNVAKIIGLKTFGKGSVQELIPLSDGSAIKITTASWFTPKGTNISLHGVMPDIELKRDNKTTADSELKEVVKMMK